MFYLAIGGIIDRGGAIGSGRRPEMTAASGTVATKVSTDGADLQGIAGEHVDRRST